MEEALAHPYLALLHDPNDEPTCESVFDFSFEDQPLTKESLKGALGRSQHTRVATFPKYYSSILFASMLLVWASADQLWDEVCKFIPPVMRKVSSQDESMGYVQ